MGWLIDENENTPWEFFKHDNKELGLAFTKYLTCIYNKKRNY